MHSTTPAETDYLRAIARGDRQALTELYQTMLPAIRRMVSELGNGSEADAKDVFQDAVMVVFEKIHQPDFELTSRFSTYFYGICRNLRLTKLKKKTGNESRLPDDHAETPADFTPDPDALEMERRKLFEQAMLRLGPDCRRLLQLHFLKTPIPEIVEKMGFSSEGYARRRKCQCKDRLIELVKQDPAYTELLTHDR